MPVVQVERPCIALNAQLFRSNQGYRSAGISRYIECLVRELPAALPEFDLNVYATDPLAPALLSNVALYKTRMAAHKPLVRILWEQTLFAWELAQKDYCLLHSLAYVSPFLNWTPGVVTLYDLAFFVYPQYFPPLQRLYLQVGTRLSTRRARRVIAISESTKRDAVRILQLNPARIDVALPGLESDFLQGPVSPAVLAEFRQQARLPERFVLFVGTREPRKNITVLLRAFAAARRRAQLPHTLVLAGGRGWMDQDIAKTIRDEHLENDVLLPGFVPGDRLRLWYSAADVFVYPSQYEGFGMPALEALACGTPVLTSNVSALPEAVGDAALLVSPQDMNAMADALVRLLSDQGLRAELRERGLTHARAFSWARTARATAASYRRALGLMAPQTAPKAAIH